MNKRIKRLCIAQISPLLAILFHQIIVEPSSMLTFIFKNQINNAYYMLPDATLRCGAKMKILALTKSTFLAV